MVFIFKKGSDRKKQQIHYYRYIHTHTIFSFGRLSSILYYSLYTHIHYSTYSLFNTFIMHTFYTHIIAMQ